ncbi:MAG: hypothetical protein U9R52_03645, partial [Candidatus Omnitrophota bacterium]|nr:hypothetical protein [Candidatus Omnitrophota bacterium]
AEALKCSDRHIRRMLKTYKKDGISALIHQSRGKPSPKKMPQDEINKIINLYKNKYTRFKPTHFSEMLSEFESIHRSKEKIRQILIDYKFWLSKPKKKKHRKQRERRPYSGMLVQMDGSVDPWFEFGGVRGTSYLIIPRVRGTSYLIIPPSFSIFSINLIPPNGLPVFECFCKISTSSCLSSSDKYADQSFISEIKNGRKAIYLFLLLTITTLDYMVRISRNY